MNKIIPAKPASQSTYTVEYPAPGHDGARPRAVVNWYGRFDNRADADAYLKRTQVPNGRVVKYPGSR